MLKEPTLEKLREMKLHAMADTWLEHQQDPGMHSLGWSRQRAIDFMRENSALAEHNIAVEVDRYIANPGQSLAYKMGELKIRELRAEAEKRLGADFDLREFHDAVLRQGAIPLDLLERRIHAWIEEETPAD